MKVLVLGPTGRLVIQQLINRNIETKIVVRDFNKVSTDFQNNKLLECVVGNISEYGQGKYSDLINDCDAMISCLGHNISFKGIFGKPRMLVTSSVSNICKAIKNTKKNNVKVILMNITANRNKRTNENYSLKDRMVFSFLSIVLPPQKDNVEAAKYLLNTIGENNSKIEWTAVRPDTLIDEEEVIMKFMNHQNKVQFSTREKRIE